MFHVSEYLIFFYGTAILFSTLKKCFSIWF